MKYWPILVALGGGAAWAADQYIESRIDVKVEARLHKIERALYRIQIQLGINPNDEDIGKKN